MEQPQPTPLSRLGWIAIGIIALAYAYLYYQRTLNGPFRFSDDVAQHYLWLFGAFYDTNWQDGFYASASGALQPWGYYALLKVVGQFVDPLTISRYGVFATALLTVTYATALFRRFVPLTLAVASSLVLFHYSLDIAQGFLARGFMIPLLLIFGYYLVRKDQPWGIAGSLLAAALFYPPALVINLTVLGFFKLGELFVWWRARRMQRPLAGPTAQSPEGKDQEAMKTKHPLQHWAILGGATAFSLLLIWLHSLGVKAHPSLGNFLPREVLLSAPEFGGAGRVAMTNVMNTSLDFFINYFAERYLKSGFSPVFEWSMIILAGVLGVVHHKRLGRWAGWTLALAAATLLLFLFAQAVFPLLFLPDRFIVYPWRLLALLILALNAAGIYWLLPKEWLSTLLVVLLLGYAHYHKAPKGFGFVGLDDADKYEYYDAIRALPPDALIAAPPEVASWFPVMTQRMPFLSNESAHALYFEHYHAHVMPRFAAYADAISTPGKDLTPVLAFMQEWNIDYLIVDTKLLRERRHQLWSPHKQIYEKRKDELGEEEFALLQIPEEVGIWIRKQHRIISRGELERLVEER